MGAISQCCSCAREVPVNVESITLETAEKPEFTYKLLAVSTDFNCNEYEIAQCDNRTHKSRKTNIRYIGATKLINKQIL